MYLMRTLNCRS